MVYDFLNPEEEVLRTKIIELPQAVIPALAIAYRNTYRFVKGIIAKGHRVFLLIEEPVVGKGGAYATIKQSKVHGAIVAGAVAAGADVEAVNNTSWKKTVTGKGNNSKVEVARYVRKSWRNLSTAAGPDQDLIDAGCIFHYARTMLEKRNDLRM